MIFEKGVNGMKTMFNDHERDPTELTNIGGDPEYKSILDDFRKRSDAYYEKYSLFRIKSNAKHRSISHRFSTPRLRSS